ncbi:GntR family transcriptional regulator [Planococcus glaciei]|nr:GntR family transcriptional regulator [Planococcus glaciei]
MKEEQAYKTIKNMIVQGKFTMQESISINGLAEEMNMSRTPVHKALAQLERRLYHDYPASRRFCPPPGAKSERFITKHPAKGSGFYTTRWQLNCCTVTKESEASR